MKIPKTTAYGRVPKPPKEEGEEYGPGKKEITLCKTCSAVYYHKSWHHNLLKYDSLEKDKGIFVAMCPACRMKRDGAFEGEVIIENIPKDVREEITRLIQNIGERAYARDPMDRILSLRSLGKNGLVVHTSENQLALTIGKEVIMAHKSAKKSVTLSREESVARVKIDMGGQKTAEQRGRRTAEPR